MTYLTLITPLKILTRQARWHKKKKPNNLVAWGGNTVSDRLAMSK